jgi:F-type H+-transporting ATPase subunit alpha
MQIYAATNKDDAGKRGWLREVPVVDIQRWGKEFLEFCDAKFPSVQKGIEDKKEFTNEIKAEINKAITEFNAVFVKTPGAKI